MVVAAAPVFVLPVVPLPLFPLPPLPFALFVLGDNNDGTCAFGSTSQTPGVFAGQGGGLLLGLYAAILTAEGLTWAHSFLRLLKSGEIGVGVPDRGNPSGGAPGDDGSTFAPYETRP